MASPRYDVVAIGNALVDVLCHKGDDFIAAQGLQRGLMQPIAPDRAVALHRAMGRCEEVCGGSADNSMAALARLGLRLATALAARIGSHLRRGTTATVSTEGFI